MQITAEQIALAATSTVAVAAFITAIVQARRSRSEATTGERGVAVDEREAVVVERAQAIAEAQVTTSLLREQIEILRSHRDEREAEIKAERAEWREREKKLEARVKSMEDRQKEAERDYRNLVLTVTTMGFCANAKSCADYNPGTPARETDRAE